MVCGLPGTGKSTVAKFISGEIGAELLRTDMIRKKIFSDSRYFEYGSKKEFPEKERDLVYDEMFKQMAIFFKEGKNVVLDATFHKKELRDKAAEIAEKSGVKIEIIEVTCPEWLVKKGMTERVEKQKGASTAGFEIHLKYKKIFEPIEREHLTVDTFGDWKKQLEGLIIS